MSMARNYKIQVLGAVTLQNGETKNDLVDLTCHDIAAFRPLLGAANFFPDWGYVDG